MTLRRFLLFILTAFLGLSGAVILFVPVAVLYGFLYVGRELLFVAVAIDTFYGVGVTLPIYTATTLIGLLFFDWLKPQLRTYP